MHHDTPTPAADCLLDFLHEIGRLKNLPRTGWRFHGIKDSESIADHSYRMTLLCMILGDLLQEHGVQVDTHRMIRMALLHEIAEARIGDIPFPALRYLGEEAKENAEKAAVQDMVSPLGATGACYADLWREFEAFESLEATLVRAIDKLELMIQVYEYEKQGYRSLDRFWENPWNQRGFDVHPIVREMMDELVRRRQELMRSSESAKIGCSPVGKT